MIDLLKEETRFSFLNDITQLFAQGSPTANPNDSLSELIAKRFQADLVCFYEYNSINGVLSLVGSCNISGSEKKRISSFNTERGEGGLLISVISSKNKSFIPNLEEDPISMEFIDLTRKKNLKSAIVAPIGISETPKLILIVCGSAELKTLDSNPTFLLNFSNHLALLFAKNELTEKLTMLEKQVNVDRKIITQKSQDIQKKGEKIGNIDLQLKTVVEVMLSSYPDLSILIKNIFNVVSELLGMETIAMGKIEGDFIVLDYVYDKEKILKVGDQFPSLDIFKMNIKGAENSSMEIKNPFSIRKYHNHPVYGHLGFATFLSAPLLQKRKPYGVIFAASKNVVDISPNTEDMISVLAQKLSFEIEKHNMESTLQSYTDDLLRSNHELTTITKVGQSLTSILNFDVLIIEVLKSIVDVTGCEDATLYMYDVVTDELVILLVAQEKHKKIEGFKMPSTQGIAGWVFTNKKSQIVNNTKKDERHNAEVDKMLKHETQSILCTPLLSTIGGGIGVVQLINKLDNSGYTQRDLDFLESLIPFISIALENARMFKLEKESTRKATEAQQLKSEFLSNMSHELRTPLTSIIAYTDILSRDYDKFNERQQKSVDRIKISSQHLLNLINDILDLSKIEAGMMNVHSNEVDLDSLLLNATSTFELQTQQKGLKLAIESHSEKIIFKTDETRVKQILINLISNALKFTEVGGISIIVETNDDNIYIGVKDTGMGIPENAKELIFESFRQADGSASRKAGGTGLGLAISQKLARLLGGTIQLESKVGVGSIFTLILPYKKGSI